MSELETVLDLVGWSALPLSLKIVSACYTLALVAHGNIAVVRNVVNAGMLSLRTAARVGHALVARWRRPSEVSVLASQVQQLLVALNGPTQGTPANPVVDATVTGNYDAHHRAN